MVFPSSLTITGRRFRDWLRVMERFEDCELNSL